MKKTILFTIVAVGLIGSASASSLTGDLTNGLVAYYGFNGNFNDSIGGNNLVNYGATFTSNQNGDPLNAILVSPTGYLISQNNIGVFGNQDRTISLWVNIYTNSIFPNGRLVSWGNNEPSQGSRLYAIDPANAGSLAVDYSLQNNNVSPTDLSSAWHQITYTYSGSLNNVSFYVNGLIQTNSAIINYLSSDSINTFDTPLYLNSDTPQNPQNLGINGAISDLGIWNRALSSAEVSQLYGIQSVPEPSTYALFGLGAIGMLMVLRRKKTA
jgi:hypothetical protein